MHYAFSFTVTPDDTVDNPVIETIQLASGVLRKAKIVFPRGCNGVVRCCIYNDSMQLLPINADGYYALDGDSVDASLWYDLTANTNRLYFIAWGVDADYSHSISVMFDVKEDNEPDVVLIQSRLIDVMDHLITMIRSYL